VNAFAASLSGPDFVVAAVGEGPFHVRVLYLSPRVCWPLRSGAHLRDFHLARQIASQASLTFLGLDAELVGSRKNVERELLPELHGSEIVRVRRDAGYGTLNLLRGLVGPTPISILNFTNATAMTVLEQLVGEQSFDAIQVESVHLIAYAQRIRELAPKVPILCDWHNVESEIQDRYAENHPGGLRTIYARRTAHLLRRFEQKFLRLGNAHTVCSERERQLLLSFEPSARVAVIENGVDVSYFSQVAQLPGGPRRTVVYVGLMEYHANVDAVGYFAREIWLRVRQLRPELEFKIVGARPTAEVLALASQPGITVTGTVDDLRPYYREALAAVVPLRVGGGTRLKILEAMAAGVPVISTALGAEGLAAEHNEEILLADTPSAMAEAVAGLHEASPEWHRLAENGSKLVLSRYDWNVIGKKLVRVYAENLGVNLEDPSGGGPV
jgi:polysaccharide biosynthesis protein PslH